MFEDRSIILNEMQTLFNISPLYVVKYVSAANWAHRQRMHDAEPQTQPATAEKNCNNTLHLDVNS